MWDHIKLKSKRNLKKEKATHELGEIICRNISSKELASKIHKELMFTRELFTIITIAKTLKQLRCALKGEWIPWPYYSECVRSCLKCEWIKKLHINTQKYLYICNNQTWKRKSWHFQQLGLEMNANNFTMVTTWQYMHVSNHYVVYLVTDVCLLSRIWICDRSTPSSSVLHFLPESAQTHAH